MKRNIAKALAYSFAGICASLWVLIGFILWDWTWPAMIASLTPGERAWAMLMFLAIWIPLANMTHDITKDRP